MYGDLIDLSGDSPVLCQFILNREISVSITMQALLQPFLRCQHLDLKKKVSLVKLRRSMYN